MNRFEGVDDIYNKVAQYYVLMRFDKPAGILLLLWPVLWGLWIAADGQPDFEILILFLCAVPIMRAAGSVFNDFIDRDLDRHVSRTYDRLIAAKMISPLEAIMLFTILSICVLLLALNLNNFAFKLSLLILPVCIIYPFMKRLTYLPQIFLGLICAWSIPVAFAAQKNYLDVNAGLLFIMTVLWIIVYDTMYAMVDREDDVKVGIKSTAILFDDADRIIIGSLQLTILFSQVLLGLRLELGQYYYAGLAFGSLFFIHQQYLINDRSAAKCLQAFMNNQWYGMAIFIGLYLDYMLP